MTPRKPYRVQLAPAATRQLDRLPPGEAARLRGPILALALEARPLGVEKLQGTELWRIRVGRLRVVYAIDEERLVIVLRVARRAESTYRRLP